MVLFCRIFWYLCLLANLLTSHVSAADTTQAEYFGLHIHKADSGTAWPKVHFGTWRLWDAGVQWYALEPEKNNWKFEKLDRYVGMAGLTKTSLLYPFALPPQWASTRPGEHSNYGEGRAAEPKSLDDWRNYVQTVAQRYKGKITTYEIWNEPNDKSFFSGNTDILVKLTCEAYKVLKTVDPNIRLVSPAYTGEQNTPKLNDFLSKGGSQCVDVISYHLYTTLSPPEALLPLVVNIRKVMKQNGVEQLPLWNTESGWAINNEDGTPFRGIPDYWIKVRGNDSAAFVARSLVLGRAAQLERFYWYAWDNQSLGLIEPASKAYKPGATAFGITADWLLGREAPVCKESSGLWVCSFKPESDGTPLIIWRTKKGPSSYNVGANQKLIPVQRADGTIPPQQPVNTILIDELPVLVKLSAN